MICNVAHQFCIQNADCALAAGFCVTLRSSKHELIRASHHPELPCAGSSCNCSLQQRQWHQPSRHEGKNWTITGADVAQLLRRWAEQIENGALACIAIQGKARHSSLSTSIGVTTVSVPGFTVTYVLLGEGWNESILLLQSVNSSGYSSDVCINRKFLWWSTSTANARNETFV